MKPTTFKQGEHTPLLDDEDVHYGSAESDVLSNDGSSNDNNNSSSSYAAEDLLDEHCCSANDESSVASSALDSQGTELDADDEDDCVDVNSDLNDPEPDHGSLLAKDKDNNNSGGGGARFFEGAEKRLAIYFKHSDQHPWKQDCFSAASLDLRRITREQWTKILAQVHCKILNVITNEHYHAYLLSESSLFVAKKFLMIKTCGSTTLLQSLEMILDVVFNFVGFDSIEDVYYSHKNLLLPRLQKKPHDSFINECQHLDKVFEGMAHVFGQINSDRWYLYVQHDQHDQHHVYGYDQKFDPGQLNLVGQGPQQNPGSFLVNKNEHFKFEMIMEKLDPTVMRWFYDNPLKKLSAEQVTHKSGIDSIIPGMVIDDFLFTPCGYSMNGLLGKYYMTIHIAPEAEFSYVSLETNVPQKNYPKFIEKVLQVFKPGKFMLNLFVPNFNYQKSIHYQQQLNELIECSARVGRGVVGGGGEAIVVGGGVGDDSDNGSSQSGNVDIDVDDENDRNNNSGNRRSSLTNIATTDTPAAEAAAEAVAAKSSSLDSFRKIHGLMLFEAFSQQPSISIGYDHFHVNHYRRYDFQMVQSEHLDIIYARYVNEGIS